MIYTTRPQNLNWSHSFAMLFRRRWDVYRPPWYSGELGYIADCSFQWSFFRNAAKSRSRRRKWCLHNRERRGRGLKLQMPGGRLWSSILLGRFPLNMKFISMCNWEGRLERGNEHQVQKAIHTTHHVKNSTVEEAESQRVALRNCNDLFLLCRT